MSTVWGCSRAANYRAGVLFISVTHSGLGNALSALPLSPHSYCFSALALGVEICVKIALYASATVLMAAI